MSITTPQESKPADLVSRLFVVSLVVASLFILTVKEWMTHTIVICAILSIAILCRNPTNDLLLDRQDIYTKKWKSYICVSMILPILAVFLGQCFRANFSFNNYDSPAHLLVCVPIFLAIIKKNLKITALVCATFPLTLIFALIAVTNHPNLYWGEDRITTWALDPLAFGSMCLTFGLLSIVSIPLTPRNGIAILYKLAGFILGIYLSIISGSRTGWLSLPVIFLIWTIFKNEKLKLNSIIAGALILTFSCSLIYINSNTVEKRIAATISDIQEYHWDKENKDTSIGARISFIRIALYLFEQKPLSGWGDGGFASELNNPKLKFAAVETKKLALNAGFHNEITANMVRSGIWGLISSTILFLVPGYLFFSNLCNPNPSVRKIALIASVFITCQLVSSLSNELLTLKYAASFYGVLIVFFAASLLNQRQTVNKSEI